jgi:hypothetical protein
MTPRTTLPWQATTRRRRWILKRYGRGPRKKKPDPPPPPKKSSGQALPQQKLRPPRHTTRTILYKRSFLPTPSTACTRHAPALFLAGQRRCYNKISSQYRRTARDIIRRSNHHGSILHNIAQRAHHLWQQVTTTFDDTFTLIGPAIKTFLSSQLFKAADLLHHYSTPLLSHSNSTPDPSTLESNSNSTVASNTVPSIPMQVKPNTTYSHVTSPASRSSPISKATDGFNNKSNNSVCFMAHH